MKLFERIFATGMSLKEQNDTINKLYRKEQTMPSIKRLGGKLEIILPDSFSEKESEEFADKLCQKASEQILGDQRKTVYRSRTAEKLTKKLVKNNKRKKK